MLAVNRTDRVSGRMILLTNSIITINGAKSIGDPVGTKCLRTIDGDLIDAIVMCPTQMGRANLTQNTKCLEGVNT